jgi:hypothetical protein
MSAFLRHTALLLLVAFLLLEALIRAFDLAVEVVPETNLGGHRLYVPGSRGSYVAGGLGEIRGSYRINAQGWNAVVDYGVPDTALSSVALIGDSFIEGFPGRVEKSVGRMLEGLLPGTLVHEYGKSGGNICDHRLVYAQWVEGRYDHVFIWVTDDDLRATAPYYMGRGESYRGLSAAQRVYYSSALLRYLGLNHKLGIRLKARWEDLGSGGREAEPSTPGTGFLEGINLKALEGLGPEVVFLYGPGKLHPDFPAANPSLEVRHGAEPYTYGFDGHWNRQGQLNCARTLRDHIRGKPADSD